VLPAASKASGVDTGAPASASCPYGTNAESPLMPAGANRPLAGIVVLDFGQVYQGPYATLLTLARTASPSSCSNASLVNA
jgi:hypothetical protein